MGTNIDRQRRPHLPLAQHVGLKATLGVAATTCSYTRLDRHRPARLHRRPIPPTTSRSRPSTCTTPRRPARRSSMVNTYREPGMERYWVPVDARERALRHQDHRPLLPIDTAATSPSSPARSSTWSRTAARPAFVDEHTDGFESCRARWPAPAWETRESIRAPRAEMPRFAQMIGEREARRLRLEHGRHPARLRRGHVRAIVNLALTQGVRRPRQVRADADPRPLRRPGRRRDGRLRDRVPRRHAGQRGERGQALASVGLRVPDRAGLDRAGDDRRRASRRARRAVRARAAISSRRCPTPTTSSRRWRGCRCASTWTSCSPVRCWSSPDETVVFLPAATRYEVPGGVTQTSTERRIMFSPEIEGRASARPARNGRSSSSWPRVSPGDAERRPFRRHGRRSAREIAGSYRPTTASSSCTRPAIRSSTAVRSSAPAGSSPPRTAGLTSALACREVAEGDADAHLHPARQAVQHDGPGASGRDHGRSARVRS